MTPLNWFLLIGVGSLAFGGLCFLLAHVWYDDQDEGGWDE